MNAAIVAVGSELLLAGRDDDNGEWLTTHLERLGASVRLRARVDDDPARIAAAVGAAGRAAGLVIVTGGLGPTEDDRTREGIALALDLPIERDPEMERILEARFAARSRAFGPEQRRQASRPRGATWIDNPVGSAPGFLIEGSFDLAALPGVPAEMRAMFEAALAPRVRARSGFPPTLRVLRTAGVTESGVDGRLRDLYAAAGAEVTLLAKPTGVEVVLRVRGGGPEQARERLETLAREMSRRLGDDLYGTDDETLPQVVGRLLLGRGATVATAESCTGGLLGGALTEVPGSSGWYRGGIVAYADDLKRDLGGVPEAVLREHGAVSEAVAGALADATRRRCAATFGLAITGVAGPGGATPGKPVGRVHIALAGPDGVRARALDGPGDRPLIRARSVTAALDLLRRALLAP